MTAEAPLRRDRALSPVALRWIAIVALLVLWEVGARAFGDPAYVAPPSKVIPAFWPTIAGDPNVARALGVAFLEIVIAFVLAAIVGTAGGIAIGATNLGRRSFFPFVLLLYGLPQVIILPLFVLVFGLGPPSRVAFGFTHGVLPILVTVISGMRGVNPLFLSSARSQGASRTQVLRHVVFPTIAAALFTSLRLSMSLTMLGVILAELYVSSNGIGSYTQIFAQTFKPASLYALIAALALMALAINATVGLIERRFTRWAS